MSALARRRQFALALVALALAASLASALACGSGSGESVPSVPPDVALAKLRSDAPPLFLDVRTPAEYERAHIPGALNVPHEEVPSRIDEIRTAGRGGEIIVLCERGGRARLAVEALEKAGVHDLARLGGDMRHWRRTQMPTVSGPERGALDE